MFITKLTQINGFFRNTWKNCLGTIVPRRSSERRTISPVVEWVLESFVDEIPLAVRHSFYFEQDGAPYFLAGEVRSWLDQVLPERWIGCRGPIEWSPRSPDLMLPRFFSGVIYSYSYHTQPRTIDIKGISVLLPYGSLPRLWNVCDSVCNIVSTFSKKRRDIKLNICCCSSCPEEISLMEHPL